MYRINTVCVVKATLSTVLQYLRQQILANLVSQSFFANHQINFLVKGHRLGGKEISKFKTRQIFFFTSLKLVDTKLIIPYFKVVYLLQMETAGSHQLWKGCNRSLH